MQIVVQIRKTPPFSGIFVALPTPYREGAESIDEEAFARHVQWLVDHGVHGVIPCGTTGESTALTPEEQRRLIQIALDICQKKCAVIPGTGAPTTSQALSLTRQAQDLGCDGALVVTPYYVGATQEGLLRHYQTLHDSTDVPLILYNNPNRTGVELSVSTVVRLMDLPRIVGIKDCGPLTRPLELSLACACEDFSLLSGDDDTFLPFMAQGGHGLISVAAGCAPAQYVSLYHAWMGGDLARARELWQQIWVLIQALKQAPNPMAIKYACAQLGFGSATTTRLPLPCLKRSGEEAIIEALQALSVVAGQA